MSKLVFETPNGDPVELPLQRVSVINLQPGDAIVLHLPTGYTAETWETVAEGFKALFPDHAVIGTDVGLSVLNAGELDGERHVPAL